MSWIAFNHSPVVNRLLIRMFSVKHSYEDAVRKLNLLQSNKSTLEQAKKDIMNGQKCTNIEDMERYLLRTGVTMSDLDQLSVIHVAGTKGKGSTSAMCESILRHHGFRTGFYSSPHLVAVRERIRLAGQVVSEEKFARYFHHIYDMLDATKSHEGDMPKYFAFLTVMAYNVFLKEKVDVAIVEVGIGGIVDATNVIRKVPVVGITALGLDHTAILGDTIERIAAAKAGVMKPACAALTAPQPEGAMRVLCDTARQVQCTLNQVPDFDTYTFPNVYGKQLHANLEAYKMNASLAIQLAHTWMRSVKKQSQKNVMKKICVSGKILQHAYQELDAPYINNGLDKDASDLVLDHCSTQISEETALGLYKCRWPGRYQVVETTYATIFLDGAHTRESMEICSQWFHNNNKNQYKILIFSATGDRKSEVLLKPLVELGFRQIYFVIPTAYKRTNTHNDNYSAVESKDLMARCQRNKEAWQQLQNGGYDGKITILESVSDALISIKNCKHCNTPAVLVTGSLHLVGATLSIIDPNLSGT